MVLFCSSWCPNQEILKLGIDREKEKITLVISQVYTIPCSPNYVDALVLNILLTVCY